MGVMCIDFTSFYVDLSLSQVFRTRGTCSTGVSSFAKALKGWQASDDTKLIFCSGAQGPQPQAAQG